MRNDDNERVNRAIAYMRDRLDQPVTVADLARREHYSEHYFIRVFRRVTGYTPVHYLSVMRFHRACHLLAETDLPVIEVALRVGYSSHGTFSDRFHRRVGVSPSAYRHATRRYREPND